MDDCISVNTICKTNTDHFYERKPAQNRSSIKPFFWNHCKEGYLCTLPFRKICLNRSNLNAMQNFTSDTALLQTFHALPYQFQEEAWTFMQFLMEKQKKAIESGVQNKPTEKKKKRQIGFFPKGTFILSADFDQPLDDFNEYMY